jgi:3-isopropylmalate/(R)-2-methylmalate dehydratase large subunit
MGVEHALLPEKGLVLPGEVIIGADSHTCTYGALGAFSTGVGSTDMACAMARGVTWFKVPSSIKFNITGKFKKWVGGKDLILKIIGDIGVNGAHYRTMEYTGPGIKNIEMDERFTIANMAIEAGAKNGIFPVDSLTKEYIKKRAKRKFKIYESDKEAVYEKEYSYDLSKIDPQVALPHLPENSRDVGKVKNVKIDQVIIGSCTNGRIKDLEISAKILKGKKVAKNLRLIIIPATQDIFKETIKRGWMEIFVNAGAAVSTPTCGPCLGGHMGILAKGEKSLATTNRNFVGRMGHPESEVYLAGPAVAAASAITGRITHPEEI